MDESFEKMEKEYLNKTNLEERNQENKTKDASEK